MAVVEAQEHAAAPGIYTEDTVGEATCIRDSVHDDGCAGDRRASEREFRFQWRVHQAGTTAAL